MQALLEQFEQESVSDQLAVKPEKSSHMEPEDVQRQQEKNEVENAEFLKLIGLSKNLLVDLRDIEQTNEAAKEAQK